MISRHSVALMRRRTDRNTSSARRSITFMEAGSASSAADIRTAEQLVVAARENVRFLNRHLRKFRACLELPHYVDNALYLAYTIRVKDAAPFTATDLRRFLHASGIDTASSYSFDFGDDPGNPRDESIFCLACHRYLTIPDLEYMVEAFELFFAGTQNSSLSAPEGRD